MFFIICFVFSALCLLGAPKRAFATAAKVQKKYYLYFCSAVVFFELLFNCLINNILYLFL